MGKFKAVFFDCDGVVIDSGADISNSVNATLSHFGMKTLALNDLISFVGNGARNLLLRAIAASNGKPVPRTGEELAAFQKEPSFDEVKFNQIMKWYREYYNSHAVVETKICSGLEPVLRELKAAGIFLGVVTNKPDIILLNIFSQFKIDDCFDALIGSDKVKHLKPAADGLVIALEKINKIHGTDIRPEETLMVGDSSTDIMAGRSFGAKTCGVLDGLGDREKLLLEKPDYKVQLASEIISFVK